MSSEMAQHIHAKFVGNEQVADKLYEHTFLVGSGVKFLAGQYQAIHTTNKEIIGPFSILTTPSDLPFVKYISRTALALSHGEHCTLSPATGAMTATTITPEGQKYIMLAGGTGITPFISLINQHQNLNIELYWSIKSDSDKILINKYLSSIEQEKIHFHQFEDDSLEQYLKLVTLEQSAIYYIAGPYVFVDKVGQFLIRERIQHLFSDMKKF